MHDHQHHQHSQEAESEGTSNITFAFLLNASFTVIEIVGGLWTNSVAILADALHDMGDTLSLGFSWYMERISKRKRDAQFSYGYKRFSLLAAFLNSLILICGSLLILSQTIPRLWAPQPVHAEGMLGLALLGFFVNGLAAYRMRTGKTMNDKLVSWHLLEDVLGWAAILVGSMVMMFADLPILDSMLSLGITLYVLWNVTSALKQTLMIFLQSIPDNVDIPLLEQQICDLAEVQSIHDTHVWTLDGAYHILTTHVVLPLEVSAQAICETKQKIRKLTQALDIDHATIEIELPDEVCHLKEC
ncbi:cation diffusion facilitator family transporter [Deltaproteobacteria bacterium TL4]